MAISLFSAQDVLDDMRAAFKALRLTEGWTQDALATRSGVSLGSLKRFENSGQIALDSLFRLASTLGCLERFHDLAANLTPTQTNLFLDDLLAAPPAQKRGRRT